MNGIGMDMGVASNAPRGLMPGGGMKRAALGRCCRAWLLVFAGAITVATAAPAAPAASPPDNHAALHGKRVLFLSSYDYGRAGIESYTRTYMKAMLDRKSVV